MADIVATIAASGADYTSLSAAEAGQQATYANLVTGGNTMTFRYNAAYADTTAATIDGWTTDATHTITVDAPSYRHNGTRGSGARLTVNSGFNPILFVNDNNVTVKDIEITNTANPGAETYGARILDSTGCKFISCLFYHCHYGLQSNGVTVSDAVAVNCIFYGCVHGAETTNSSTMTLYFCTSLNNTDGYIRTGGTMTFYNCYAGGNTTDYNVNGGSITHTTSHSSDTTGDTQTSVANCHFTSSTAGSENCHIDGTSALFGAGTGGTGYTTDCWGETRAATPCVGADEYVAAAAIGYQYYYQCNQ